MKQWFSDLSLSFKQILVLVVAGLVPMFVVMTFAVSTARSDLEQKAFGQLEAVRDIKASAIQRYFKRIQSQLVTMAQTPSVISAMDAFSRSFVRLLRSYEAADITQMRDELKEYYVDQFGQQYAALNNGIRADTESLIHGLDDEAVIAQYLYIQNNVHPLGEKHQLDAADARGVYHQAHALYHPFIRAFLEEFGYYDIFLVDINSGDIVYSVFKELDYGTSLLEGAYAQTSFAQAFREALDLGKGEFSLKDYRPYTPSYEAPASFIATPIFREDQKIGVLIFQMPLESINDIMSERSGMGASGETYLVGEDLLMRSDSFFDPSSHTVNASFRNPEEGRVDTVAARAAINGERGNKIVADYNDDIVLSSFAPIDIAGFNWAILAEIDKAEAFAPITMLMRWTIIIAVVMMIGLILFAILIARTLSNPILKLANAIQDVQRTGDFTLRVNTQSRDEIGETSKAFNAFLSGLQSAISDSNQVLDAMSHGEFSQRVTHDYPGDLSLLTQGVNTAIAQVSSSSQEAHRLTSLAEEKAQEAEAAANLANKQAEETLVVKQALDVSATAVMITDANFTIVYQNHTSATLMQNAEACIRSELPDFNVESLIGTNFDVFHKSPQKQRKLISQLESTHRTQISIGEMVFSLAVTPIFTDSGTLLGSVVEWIDKTSELAKLKEERRISEENARIRQALDSSSTACMIFDEGKWFIYANVAFQSMIDGRRQELMQYHTQLSPKNLQGSLLSHLNFTSILSEQSLNECSKTQTANFSVGRANFRIHVSPIYDQKNHRIGFVVEWQDRTEEVRIEHEIDGLIERAANGHFDRQLSVHDKTGFFKVVAEGLNQLVGTISHALEQVKCVFQALSEGDLKQSFDGEFQGEYLTLQENANQTIRTLKQILKDIRAASQEITKSSKEINTGMLSLGDRTEHQAASLEETAASMDEMNSTVKQSVEKINEGNEFTSRSVSIAHKGRKVVVQTGDAMLDIAASSNQIANIITVIDDIAFQTNLLALNAAVEAARAGEQGRGFAVVASEVRNLAQRSATAAKEIKQLIEDSVNKVNDGAALVKHSDEIIQSIVTEIEQVSQNMDEILVGSREQSQGISQVNQAVAQMDSVTQENAAMVEQAIAASNSMAGQASQLDKLVAFFKQ